MERIKLSKNEKLMMGRLVSGNVPLYTGFSHDKYLEIIQSLERRGMIRVVYEVIAGRKVIDAADITKKGELYLRIYSDANCSVLSHTIVIVISLIAIIVSIIAMFISCI